MENSQLPDNKGSEGKEYKRFAAKRIVAGILITALVIWMASLIFGFFDKEPHQQANRVDAGDATRMATRETGTAPTAHDAADGQEIERYKTLFERKLAAQGAHLPATRTQEAAGRGAPGPAPTAEKLDLKTAGKAQDHAAAPLGGHEKIAAAAQPQAAPADSGHASAELTPHTAAAPDKTEAHPAPSTDTTPAQAPAEKAPSTTGHGAPPAPVIHKAPGVAFVEALIHPLDHELNERFWGWRANDIIDVTDNVNNFQLGVLEVTRRTTVILTEKISRIGGAASFDENMEQAMNWFMIKPSRYWLPSPEDKYNDGLDNLRKYADGLGKGLSRFYIRSDNLIPLLAVYQDLLGSCDENLVKAKEDNGENVSFFKADDYFFYAQGVASAMMGILEAVHHEFASVLETRKAREALQHAIETLHHAGEISPWIILNSDLSSIFANHRANMAAPISHARFYLGVAIGALST